MVLNTEGWFGALRALTESPRALRLDVSTVQA